MDPDSRDVETIRKKGGFDESTLVGCTATPIREEEHIMLQTIAIVLILLWILGFATAYTIGGFIHVLLVVAIILFLVRFIQGRKL